MNESAEEILDKLAELLTDRVAAKIGARAPANEWITQKSSPLGSRAHCATVRKRIEAGKGGAMIVGRQHKLTRAALDEEIARRHGRAS